jgi:surfactin family lipopeptide synthetase A/bacitracin synthase 2
LSLGSDEDWSSFILAAYGVLLFRLNGQEDMTIVASLDGAFPQSPLPLRLFPSWSLTFTEFLQAVRQKTIVSKPHRVYGLHILTNPLTLSEYGCPSPVFDVGYSYGDADRGPDASGLGLYPAVDKGLRLLLKVTRNEAELSFEFSYMKTWFTNETIEKLSSYLDSILKEAVINPAVVIGEIALQSGEEQESESAMAVDANEAFNF